MVLEADIAQSSLTLGQLLFGHLHHRLALWGHLFASGRGRDQILVFVWLEFLQSLHSKLFDVPALTLASFQSLICQFVRLLPVLVNES